MVFSLSVPCTSYHCPPILGLSAELVMTYLWGNHETGEQILFHLFSYSGAYPFSFPELQSAAMSWIQINVIPKLSVVNIIIHKRYSWQLTVWEKQKIIQALQYNSITVSINHIFALVLRKCHTDYMDDTDFYLQVPSLFNITQIFWSSEDRVKARFYSVESRQNKPKANHRNLLSTEHTENTEKIKVKETLWGRCSSAFSSLIYLLWYALGLYYQERIIKKLCEVGNKNIYNKVK